jgi:hypothetical protein
MFFVNDYYIQGRRYLHYGGHGDYTRKDFEAASTD